MEFHQVAFRAAAVQTGVAEITPEPVRVHRHASLLPAPGDHLVYAAGGQRAPVIQP
jgi:hypothetical protein